jgi:hypothetical protein
MGGSPEAIRRWLLQEESAGRKCWKLDGIPSWREVEHPSRNRTPAKEKVSRIATSAKCLISNALELRAKLKEAA